MTPSEAGTSHVYTRAGFDNLHVSGRTGERVGGGGEREREKERGKERARKREREKERGGRERKQFIFLGLQPPERVNIGHYILVKHIPNMHGQNIIERGGKRMGTKTTVYFRTF